eukprot:TRINITY_DN2116_c0_g1_i1.p1 TRINITY_DN2116_c0_g1~~TRINITY_DN2116_c0_g1_i1.p1  ORF type:complete len:543 (+),score=118.03 TRINITY_DN2116_c0_g1_i1:2091-3719(+)
MKTSRNPKYRLRNYTILARVLKQSQSLNVSKDQTYLQVVLHNKAQQQGELRKKELDHIKTAVEVIEQAKLKVYTEKENLVSPLLILIRHWLVIFVYKTETKLQDEENKKLEEFSNTINVKLKANEEDMQRHREVLNKLEAEYNNEKEHTEEVEESTKRKMEEQVKARILERDSLESNLHKTKEQIEELQKIVKQDEKRLQEVNREIISEQSKAEMTIEKEKFKLATTEQQIKETLYKIQALESESKKLEENLKGSTDVFSKLWTLEKSLQKEIEKEKLISRNKKETKDTETSLKEKILENSKVMQSLAQKIKELVDKKTAINSKATDIAKFLQNAKAKLNKLEDEKEEFVASKSFQEAANISVKIKSGQDDLALLEENLAEFQKEAHGLSDEVLTLEEAYEKEMRNSIRFEEELEKSKYHLIEAEIQELQHLSNLAKEGDEEDEKYALVIGRQIAIYQAELKEIKLRIGIIEGENDKTAITKRIKELKAKATELEKEIEELAGKEEYEKAEVAQNKLGALQEELAKLEKCQQRCHIITCCPC